jgi:hypothetical protein
MAKERMLQLSLRLPADLVAELESERFGESLNQVIRARLVQALKLGPRNESDLSELEKIERRQKEAKAKLAEIEAAKAAGSVVDLDMVKQKFGEMFLSVRQRILGFANSVFGLSPTQYDELKNAVADCLHDLANMSGENRRAVWLAAQNGEPPPRGVFPKLDERMDRKATAN